MSGQTPELEDLVLGAIAQVLDGVYTSMPGVVVSYNAALRAADVQPLVPQGYVSEEGDRIPDTHPILQRVPVLFPGGANGELLFPITKGDIVTLHFANCSLDKFKATGALVDPEDDRRHHLGDAVATPGLQSFKGTRAGVTDRVALTGDRVCLGDVDTDDTNDAVMTQVAITDFHTRLTAAIGTLSANPVAAAALAALQTALFPGTGVAWSAGTSKTKAK